MPRLRLRQRKMRDKRKRDRDRNRLLKKKPKYPLSLLFSLLPYVTARILKSRIVADESMSKVFVVVVVYSNFLVDRSYV